MATTAGEALLAYLGQQLDELRRQAPGVRGKQPEAVHQMRVAARRLRSLLASGRPLFDDGAAEPLRDELRWLSGLLGAARDPGVVRERLATLLAQEPAALRGVSGPHGPAATRIDGELNALAAAGFDAVLDALGNERYAQLLAELERLVTDAALSPKSAGAAGARFGKIVAKDRRRLQRAVTALPARADDGEARDAGLHEIRKAAKRLRYSAELAASLPKRTGKKRRRSAKRTAKSARKIQQLLGLHQDSVVARQRLAELARRAQDSGENAFIYGRLHAKEEALAAAAERDFLDFWDSASRPSLGGLRTKQPPR
ncbi:CHAD domain-containing protein [Arthrobacter sp. Hor0625]|uniref:CHAD domain-containing protein n=1 Tax=Arthrobacter sp. Hor0625 TaxID=3457358 RepID=UPI00403E575A